MDTFSLLSSAPSPKVEKTIEVNLEDLEQFFNTMDPSPFHEKDLDHDLEEFIVSWATEYSLHDPLRLVVYLQNRSPGTDAQSVIERAVHNYFAYRTGLNQREFKQLLREGRISLLIGLLFLTVCLSGGQMASRLDIPGANIVETSLTIAGWVAMWHPMDVFLYGWWPLRRAGKVYRKLSAIPVEVRYSAVPGEASKFLVHSGVRKQALRLSSSLPGTAPVEKVRGAHSLAVLRESMKLVRDESSCCNS